MPTKLDPQLQALQQGRLHDPFDVLGRHPVKDGELIRAFLPNAERVVLVGQGEMQRLPGTDLFEYLLAPQAGSEAAPLEQHYQLNWQEKADGRWHTATSPYSFQPLLGDQDLHLFSEGRHHHAYRFLGAHLTSIDDVDGCLFAVWAPAVQRVSVVGDFNGWNGLRHPMRNRGGSGVWELFIPGLQAGDLYKFELLNRHGHLRLKADPYGQAMTLRPDTASRIAPPVGHRWQDQSWLEQRAVWDWQHQPMSIYEVHPGSWQRHADNSFLNYRDLADRLVQYVLDLGYTHIELLPVMEHPLDESWGYQVTGYFAPTARFGSADDLRYLIDQCHRNHIGVLLDWVPGHFPKDDFALARFTGDAVYEHEDPRRGEHRDWGTLIFDYGRNEVRNFLLTNAIYWFEEFHIDGIRVDAVASMLYLDYSRNEGDWLPNQYGGRENLDAINFLREMNEVIHQRFPGGLTIAEESTAWPMVSRPTYLGGLGFSMKWNMGWMNDTLSYMEMDPVHRRYHHNNLTFSQLYAYSENFVLPLSHDEVVHMKRSLLEKMPGDHWQKFANLRLLYLWQYAHPGKKLMFMGGELGQWMEWDEAHPLDWALLQYDTHKSIQQFMRDLNHLYRSNEALYALDFESDGFAWIECNDADQSVIAFIRKYHERKIICILNFTPVVRKGYRIGLPDAGRYREIINSDAAVYGGSNCGNSGAIETQTVAWMGMPQSAELTLPPLGGLLLELDVS
ncbi:MAG: 1,4-alpha-glucan branching protein GlgB [Chromatiales bacterium]|jgi:1,4-alpha-glucan branching enzyme